MSALALAYSRNVFFFCVFLETTFVKLMYTTCQYLLIWFGSNFYHISLNVLAMVHHRIFLIKDLCLRLWICKVNFLFRNLYLSFFLTKIKIKNPMIHHSKYISKRKKIGLEFSGAPLIRNHVNHAQGFWKQRLTKWLISPPF